MRRLALALALLWPSWALAQNAPSANPAIGIAGAYNAAPLTCTDGQACWLQTDANGQLLVSASVSATVTGFAPGGVYATLTASGSSADVALPAGTVVAFQNSGTTTVSCILSVGAGTATASKNLVPPSSTVYLTVGSNTHGSCIDQSGSTSNVVVLSGGAGIGTGFGGGGGSGGGGAVTVADGADVAEGATTDAAATQGSTGTVSAKLRTITSQLNTTNSTLSTISTNVSSAIPAGSNLIGLVTVNDGTNSQKVLAASTRPAQADKAAVIALSPNPPTYCDTAGAVAVNITSSTDLNTFTNTGFICGISLVIAAAETITVVEGTGTVCATSTKSIVGSTTAADATHGVPLAANGGFVTMFNPPLALSGTAKHLCITKSGSGLLGGTIWTADRS